MNERIRQIRQEAWAFVKHDLETVERDHVVMYSEHLEMHYAKFAELIVRECADRIVNTLLADLEGPDPDDVLWLAAKQVKEHFGVEE